MMEKLRKEQQDDELLQGKKEQKGCVEAEERYENS